MSPTKHLLSKHGCKKCGTDSMARLQRDNTHHKFDEFIKTSDYNYSKAVFDKTTDKINIICKNHGVFSVTVDHHMNGTGCKKCADQNKTGGYNEKWFNFDVSRKELPGLLYVLEMYSDTERFIKIGMTKNTIQQRYRGSKYNYNVLKTCYGSLYQCYKIETLLKDKFFNNLYLNGRKIHTTESFNIECKDAILGEIMLYNTI